MKTVLAWFLVNGAYSLVRFIVATFIVSGCNELK